MSKTVTIEISSTCYHVQVGILNEDEKISVFDHIKNDEVEDILDKYVDEDEPDNFRKGDYSNVGVTQDRVIKGEDMEILVDGEEVELENGIQRWEFFEYNDEQPVSIQYPKNFPEYLKKIIDAGFKDKDVNEDTDYRSLFWKIFMHESLEESKLSRLTKVYREYGWICKYKIELPDDEEFDSSKLCFIYGIDDRFTMIGDGGEDLISRQGIIYDGKYYPLFDFDGANIWRPNLMWLSSDGSEIYDWEWAYNLDMDESVECI